MKVVSYERRGCKSAGDRQCIARLRFWPEDDGWSGVCERLMVIVRGSSFEDAKQHKKNSLQEHIERILPEQLGRGAHEVAYLCQ